MANSIFHVEAISVSTGKPNVPFPPINVADIPAGPSLSNVVSFEIDGIFGVP